MEPHMSLRMLYKASKWKHVADVHLRASHRVAILNRHTLNPPQGRVVCSAGRWKGCNVCPDTVGGVWACGRVTQGGL